MDTMLDIGATHRIEYEITNKTEPVVIAESPARIHFLGEHGEAGAGLYLSAGINRTVQVAVSSRKDNSLRFYAANLNERKRTTLANLKYKREDRWANYLKMAIYLFIQAGVPLKGLNFTIIGDIPQHIGLASSSAIQVATAIALKKFLKASIPDKELVKKLVQSKIEFFGKESASPVDYLIALNAKKDHFLIVDEKSHEVAKIKSPFSRYKILLLDSRVPRMGVEEELNLRRQDVRKGLQMLLKKRGGKSFRDFSQSDILESMGDLREGVRRRSLHIVDENRRVIEAAEALHNMEFEEFSRVILSSHESLRDYYEVSCPEIDWLVKRGQEVEGVAATRMTGSGFGGCTYTILKESVQEQYIKRTEDYERIFGFRLLVHELKISSGARIIAKG